MDIKASDVRALLEVARTLNLRQSATHLHLTPSALSKAIKRVEQGLGRSVFQRQGKRLALYPDTKELLLQAEAFLKVHAALKPSEQTIQHVSISGPELLLHAWLPELARVLDAEQVHMKAQSDFENQALIALTQGRSDIALVTAHGAHSFNHPDVVFQPIKEVTFLRAYGKGLGRGNYCVPTHSPWCGNQRGVGADGWPQTEKRTITMTVDHMSVIPAILKRTEVVAYLPDFIVSQQGLNGEAMPWPHKETIGIAVLASQLRKPVWQGLIQSIKSTLKQGHWQ